jgi:hypothetical protein
MFILAYVKMQIQSNIDDLGGFTYYTELDYIVEIMLDDFRSFMLGK